MIKTDWKYLPDSLLLKIFQNLAISDLSLVARVCQNWYRICQDELLWKYFFIKDFKLNSSVTLPKGEKVSWKLEYKRLMDEVPFVECQVINDHYNQVLHVAFSNNGEMFSTSSKDSSIIVYAASHPCRLLYYKNMQIYQWNFAQFSQFNSTDDLLLVSGAHYGESSSSGEIIIFKVEDGLPMKCRAINRPYDLFGAWYNSEYFLSGEFHWLGYMNSVNMLWLNRASQEIHSEHVAVISRFCQFFNKRGTSIRSVMIFDDPKNSVSESFLNGNNCPENNCAEQLMASSLPTSTSDESTRGMMESEFEPDKILIFTKGSRVCTPHEIAIKVIRQHHIETTVRVDPEITRRLIRRRAERELIRQGIVNPENNYEVSVETIEGNCDTIDHVIDMEGQIVGMALSPDKKFLYVNCRSWAPDVEIGDPLLPIDIANQIDIHVIDLTTLQKVGTLVRAEKSYTPQLQCYFIFLDVSHRYIASGAEDHRAYIWDRFYQICLARLHHSQTANCAAFNPTDPEMLVTVEDDNRIKVWRSRSRIRHLKIDSNLRNSDERRTSTTNFDFKHS